MLLICSPAYHFTNGLVLCGNSIVDWGIGGGSHLGSTLMTSLVTGIWGMLIYFQAIFENSITTSIITIIQPKLPVFGSDLREVGISVLLNINERCVYYTIRLNYIHL
jgi:hypothetical protein